MYCGTNCVTVFLQVLSETCSAPIYSYWASYAWYAFWNACWSSRKIAFMWSDFYSDSNVCAQVFVSLVSITFKKIPCSWLVTREGRDAATASGLHQL